jgi:hypothetical protein
LSKVEGYGIVGDAKHLLCSYLSNRKQFVEIDGIRSDLLGVECGVPQGSILGPTLFLIYVNDLFQIGFRGALQLYADDAVLTYGEVSVEELERSIKHDLNLLHTWLAASRLSMNISKTRFMIFELGHRASVADHVFDQISFQGQIVSRVTEYKYLGLCIDSRLNWSSHIGHITKKISPYIGVFRRISSYVVPETILNLYFSYVHSHISYLTCIWGTAANCRMNILQRLQNKAVKYLYGLPRLHPTVLLYNSRILPVSSMSNYDMLTTVYRIRCGHLRFNSPIVLVSDTHSHNTRSSSNMLLRCYRSSTGRKSIFYEGFRLFDELPPHVRQLSNICQFKTEVKKLLIAKYRERSSF